MDEKRKAERLEDVNEVTIAVISDKKNLPEEKVTHGYSMNISVSGARIKTDVLLPVETLLKVDFSLEDMQRKIGTIGQVKWMKVVIEDESYNEGVKFDNPSRNLADYIAWKQKSRSPI